MSNNFTPRVRDATVGGILLYETSSSSSRAARPKRTPSETPTCRTDFTNAPDAGFRLHHDHAESRMSDRDYPILADGGLFPNKAANASINQDPTSTQPIVSSFAILLGALVGVGGGIALYFVHIGPDWLRLVALPGSLFLRALQCLVLPLVFCVMTVVVAQMAAIGRSSTMRWQTVLPFALTSILATTQGFVLALAFKSLFQVSSDSTASSSSSALASASSGSAFNLTLQCANGLYLAVKNDSLACVGSSTDASALFTASNQTRVATGSLDYSSLVDLVVNVANILVPSNIFASFNSGSLLSIVVFSVPLGIAAATANTNVDEPNHILGLFRQLRNVFLRMLHALLFLTPVAVAFLVASSIANFDKYYTREAMTQLAVLFAAFVIGIVCHSVVVLPLYVFIATKANPFVYFRQLLPAYLFAFGSASSLATLPIAIECIERAKISRAIAHVAMPFGTPINLNGAGLYYPLAMVFMANMAGMDDQWNTARLLVLFIVSFIGCVATAPMPGAGTIYLSILWRTCFPSTSTPVSFAVLVAADFIFDRVCTMVNLHGNIAVTRILADQIDETFEVQAAPHV
ncbi:hypothetical protein LEN26_018833 [Aphanomyces euteiches]|nr:hypothetical protein LEN26_018833 [Aphanomyces euteiches]KAH9104972.1 hypothetical protein AeMF1_019095 [Aphanomyces euteiches]KAH9194173.1 hypothetical protein AeNC1_003850 [Aphanomyces euteiches]